MNNRERAEKIIQLVTGVHALEIKHGGELDCYRDAITQALTLVREEAERNGFERGRDAAAKVLDADDCYLDTFVGNVIDRCAKKISALRPETSNQTGERK